MNANNMIYNKCFHEKYMSLALSLAMILLFSTFYVQESYLYTQKRLLQDTYGYHNGIAFDISEASALELAQHAAVKQTGRMYVYGDILTPESSSAGMIGSVDKGFMNLENLTLLEGRYPENNNEIAMESLTLDLMQLPYEIDVPVHVTIRTSNGDTVTKEYILCGIIKPYTTNWESDSHELCSAFVLPLTGIPYTEHLFLKTDHTNSLQFSELSQITYGGSHSELVYNSFSYPDRSSSLSATLSRLLVPGLVSLISCIILVSIMVSSYKEQVYTTRILLTLGCDPKEVRHTLFRHTFLFWAQTCFKCMIIVSVPAVCLPYMNIFKAVFHLSVFPYLLTAGISLFILILGKSVQWGILKKTQILPSGKDLTRYSLNLAKNVHHRFIHDEKGFKRTEAKLRMKNMILETAAGALSMITLFCCLFMICSNVHYFLSYNDIAGADYEWYSTFPSAGLNISAVQKIKNTANIDSVVYYTRAPQHMAQQNYLSYAGHETDPYRLAISTGSGGEDSDQGIRVSVISIPEGTALWDYYIPADINLDDFRNGTSVILYLPMYSATAYGYSAVGAVGFSDITGLDIINPALSAGDTVTVSSPDSTIRAKAAFIMQKFPSADSSGAGQTAMDFLTPGTVIVSERFMQKYLNDDVLCYNRVLAFGNSRLSYEVGDKLMSAIPRKPSLSFSNQRIERETKRTSARTKNLILCLILVVICGFSFAILYQNRVILYESEHERISLLKNLGADRGFLKDLYSHNPVMLLFMLSLCINIVLIPVLFFREYGRIYSYSNPVSQWRAVFAISLHYFPLPLLFIPQIGYLFLLFMMYRWTYKKFEKRY